MAWDLITARSAANVTGTANDVALTRVMDYVIATVENLLGRGLLYKRSTARFYDMDYQDVLLPRYPIDRIVSINGNVNHDIRITHHRTGWVRIGYSNYWFYRNWIYGGNDRCVTIDYYGGFKQLPSDLEQALWDAFVTVWSGVDHTTGLPVAGSGPSVVQGGGEVDRISLVDFGSVNFNYGVTSVGDGGSGGSVSAKQQQKWGWLAPWASILQIYRSEAAPGTAFA